MVKTVLFPFSVSLFEASQSLFWASFGLVELDAFELAGISGFTRFWALLMYGSYSVINVIVLLNLLIAMMSNSYNMISVGLRFCLFIPVEPNAVSLMLLLELLLSLLLLHTRLTAHTTACASPT